MGRKSRAKRGEWTESLRSIGDSGPQPRAADTRIAVAISAALFFSVFAVYGRILTHDFINYDDPIYVVQNEYVTGGLSARNIRWAFTSFHAGLWVPLTWISYMLDVQLLGGGAGRHLLTNVVLHGSNSILIFLFFRHTTQSTWRSAAVAGLFAVHPLHVESVAWVTERKDVLSMFFFLLALWFYVGFVKKRSVTSYLLVALAFVLGFMSKPMVLTLPFVLLLLDWWPLGRFSLENLRGVRPLVMEKLPLFLLIVPGAMITLTSATGAVSAELPLGERLTNAINSYVVYLWKAIWPADLAVIYPLRPIPALTTIVSVLFLATVTVGVFHLARRFPFLTVGWLWYLGTLVPVIGIVQAGRQAMADRFLYIPLIGIYFALVWLAGASALLRRIAPVLSAFLLIALGVTAYAQAGQWKDTMTLVTHALAVTRENDIAHVLLGETLSGRGDHDGAEREFKAAIAINPNFLEAYQDLGRMKLTSSPQEAARYLQKALALEPDDLVTRARLHTALGKNHEAVDLFRRALQEGDTSADLHNDFAVVLAVTGSDREAVEQYREALRQMPTHYDARMNLGAILSRMGRNDEALQHFSAAAAARPASLEPHIYLALVYSNIGRMEDAITEVNRAMAVDPIQSNRQFTNAVKIPFKETNLREYVEFLQSRTRR